MANKVIWISIVLAALVFLSACAALKGGTTLPLVHPEELGPGRPTCTECHQENGEKIVYERYDHTLLFMRDHKSEARQGERVCSMCHQTSFCNDCHATRVELKPSDRYKTESYRQMPHRGNYLSRHRIDGRVDPTSCFRCHGNPKSSRTCAPCHP